MLVLTALVAARPAGAQTEYVWSGASALWSASAEWTPNGVPSTAADQVTVPAGTISLDANYSIGSLNLSGSPQPTLAGSGGTRTLTAAGLFSWNGGLQAIHFVANGGVSVSSIAGVSLTGGSLSVPMGQKFEHSGNASVNASGAGQTLTVGGTFHARGDGSYTGGILVNSGTILRDTSTGTYVIGASLQGPGKVQVDTGTLNLASSNSLNGPVEIAAGARLLLTNSGGVAFSPISGAGLLQAASSTSLLLNGSVNGISLLTAGSVSIGADCSFGALECAGGSIQPMAGRILHVGGLFTFGSGLVTGPTQPAALPVLNLNGGAVFPSTSATRSFGPIVVNLPAGQTLTDHGVTGPFNGMNIGAQLNIAGSMVVPNGGKWNGGGSVNVSGSLAVGDSLSVEPRLALSGGGSFQLQSGTLTFVQASSLLVDSSQLDLAAGTSLTQAFATGTFIFSGATTAVTGPGTLTLRNATISNSMAWTVSRLELLGTLSFANNQRLTLAGALSLRGVLQGGPFGSLALTGGGTILPPTTPGLQHALNGIVLFNQAGSVLVHDRTVSAPVLLQNGTVNNHGTFYAQTPWGFVNNGGVTGFYNNGTFIRDAVSGNYVIGAQYFSNTGTLEVRLGGVVINGSVQQVAGNTLTGGTWRIFSGANLSGPGFQTGLLTNQADVSIYGTGSFDAVFNVNRGQFRLLDGAQYFPSFNLSNFGLIELSNGARLSYTNSNVQFTNGAAGLVRGAGILTGRMVNDGTVAAAAGQTLNVLGTVTNNGVFRATAGAIIDARTSTFTNNGTIDRMTGQVLLPASFVNNGIVLEPGNVRVKSTTLQGGTATLKVDGYSGHSYQLQRSLGLGTDTFVNLGPAQPGSGAELTFTDNLIGERGFYRIVVSP